MHLPIGQYVYGTNKVGPFCFLIWKAIENAICKKMEINVRQEITRKYNHGAQLFPRAQKRQKKKCASLPQRRHIYSLYVRYQRKTIHQGARRRNPTGHL